jgi:ubiquinone/menaquinone biosynthesis C-methylase UbiE
MSAKQVDRDYQMVTLRFYEDNAEEYVHTTDGMYDEEWLSRFSSLLPMGGRVLDVGCAGGRDSEWFSKRGFRPHGIDVSPRLIEIARARVPTADFSVMDVLDLSFADQYFDGVWCSCVLIHLAKLDVVTALREVHRVLTSRGLLYILVKLGNSEGVEKDARYGGDEKFNSYFTETELSVLLTGAGFQLMSAQDIHVPVDTYRATDRIFVVARKP